jgi:DNA repair protein RadA/Sms
VLFGEVSLTGAIRPVGHGEQRLKEASKLGFSRAYMPVAKREAERSGDMELHALSELKDLVARFGALTGNAVE